MTSMNISLRKQRRRERRDVNAQQWKDLRQEALKRVGNLPEEKPQINSAGSALSFAR